MAAPRKGLRALVTGANKGIGKEIAYLLADAGVQVAVASRDLGRGQSACDDLRSKDLAGEVVGPIQLDVTSDASIKAALAEVEEKMGGLDILVNNAGMAYKGDIFGAEEAMKTISTNTVGTMSVTRNFLPMLERSGPDARIVNIASMSGCLWQVRERWQEQFASESLTEQELVKLLGTFVQAIRAGRRAKDGWSPSMYGMSKLGVIAYTRMLARQIGSGAGADVGPVVTCCCPGYCKTDMSSWTGRKTALEGADTPAWLALQDRDEAQKSHGLMYQDRKLFKW